MTEWNSSQRRKDGSTSVKAINVIRHIQQNKGHKSPGHLNRGSKSIGQKRNTFLRKTLNKVGAARKSLNLTKAIGDEPTGNIIHRPGEELRAFPLRPAAPKGAPPHHCYSIEYWMSWTQQPDKKKK